MVERDSISMLQSLQHEKGNKADNKHRRSDDEGDGDTVQESAPIKGSVYNLGLSALTAPPAMHGGPQDDRPCSRQCLHIVIARQAQTQAPLLGRQLTPKAHSVTMPLATRFAKLGIAVADRFKITKRRHNSPVYRDIGGVAAWCQFIGNNRARLVPHHHPQGDGARSCSPVGCSRVFRTRYAISASRESARAAVLGWRGVPIFWAERRRRRL